MKPHHKNQNFAQYINSGKTRQLDKLFPPSKESLVKPVLSEAATLSRLATLGGHHAPTGEIISPQHGNTSSTKFTPGPPHSLCLKPCISVSLHSLRSRPPQNPRHHLTAAPIVERRRAKIPECFSILYRRDEDLHRSSRRIPGLVSLVPFSSVGTLPPSLPLSLRSFLSLLVRRGWGNMLDLYRVRSHSLLLAAHGVCSRGAASAGLRHYFSENIGVTPS